MSAQVLEEFPIGDVKWWHHPAMADLDGDNRKDLVVAVPSRGSDNRHVTQLAWYRALASEPFLGPRVPLVTLDKSVDHYEVADINRDGVDDLVLVARDAESTWMGVVPGQPGGVAPFPVEWTPIQPRSITGFTLTDMDGDGWLDMLSYFNPEYGNVGWYRNPGERGVEWVFQEIYPLDHDVEPMAWDMDGDGVLEVFLPRTGILALRNGTWELVDTSLPIREEVQEDNWPVAVAASDLDHDGTMEVLVQSVWCSWNTCTSFRLFWAQYVEGAWVVNDDLYTGWDRLINVEGDKRWKIEDVTGDGHLDIVYADGFVLINDGSGSLGPEAFTRQDVADAWLMLGADLNHDGVQDWVTIGAEADMFRGREVPFQGLKSIVSTDTGWQDGPVIEHSGGGSASVLDLDGDGDLDLLHRPEEWRSNWDGIGFFTHPMPIGMSIPYNAIPAQFDDDPGMDWTWSVTQDRSETKQIWVAYRGHDGSYRQKLAHEWSMTCPRRAPNGCVRLLEPWDVDGDGDRDITMALKVDGQEANFWLQNNQGVWGSLARMDFESFYPTFGRTSDGRVVGWNLPSTDAHVFTPIPGMPASFDIETRDASRCLFPDLASFIDLADFDADGVDDIICIRNDVVYLYTYGSSTSHRWRFDHAFGSPVLMDLDQDGRTELIGDVSGQRVRWHFSEEEVWQELPLPPSLARTDPSESARLVVGDFNGDGLEDIVRTYPHRLTMHRGTPMSTAVGVETTISKRAELDLWPNPFTTSFSLQWSDDASKSPASLTVFDMLGRSVLSEDITHPQQVDIDASAWPPGVYFIRIASENGIRSLKAIRN